MGRVPPVSPSGALRLGGASLALWSASAGCVPQAVVDANNAVAAYHVGEYQQARRLLQPLAKDPNENFALNNCRLGSTDLAMYDVAGSQAALLQAYDVLNSYGTNGRRPDARGRAGRPGHSHLAGASRSSGPWPTTTSA